jgi:tetratricopeptide (TPR) repeat protein
LLGQLFEKQGRRLDAIKAYEQALSLRPNFVSAKKELERLKHG